MSKFFKALERAKQERLLKEGAAKPGARLEQVSLIRSTAPAEKRWSGEAASPAAPPVLEAEPEISHPARRVSARSRPDSAGAEWSRRPRITGINEHLVSLMAPTSFAAEQCRSLRYIVEHLRREAGLQLTAVTSPAVGDGKTTTAINLAASLAEVPGARVLLVDADLRQPMVAQQLGLSESDRVPGLMEAVLDEHVDLDSAIRKIPPLNFSVLPKGGSPGLPHEILEQPRLPRLLAQMRERFDYVVLDSPPMLAVSDCRLLARWVDGFLMVISAHKTSRKLLEEALNLMDPNKTVGIVFNRDDSPLTRYYGQYYQVESSGRKSGFASAGAL